MSRRVSIGAQAVAVGAMCELVHEALSSLSGTYDMSNGVERSDVAADVASELIGSALEVQYKPTAQKLVITFDVGIGEKPEPEALSADLSRSEGGPTPD